MKFSIIIPTYNRGYILWKAIQSVQNQSWNDWELIIVDDGSTDDTKKVVREFQSGPRIHYLYKINGGPSSARNAGLEVAEGDIVTYVDSDDQIFINYLSTAREFFEAHPDKHFALVNGNLSFEFYDQEGLCKSVKNVTTSYNFTPTLQDFYDWKAKSAVGTGCFFRSTSFKGKVKWNETFTPLEELDFLLQLAVIEPEGFMFIPHILYNYKQKYGGDGVCSNASYEAWAHAFEKIHVLHKDDPLMRNPDVFLERVKKYRQMEIQCKNGEIPPSQFKYFPEFFRAVK